MHNERSVDGRTANESEAPELDQDVDATRLSGVLSARLGHRGGMIQPEVELSGVAGAAGRDAGAPVLGVRLAAGAAVVF